MKSSERWSEMDLANRVAENRDLRLSRDSRPASKPSGQTATTERSGAIPPGRGGKAADSTPLQPLSFTIPGPPCPKPRQTRSDKWKKRPSVVRYRDWADLARAVSRKVINRKFPGLVLRSYGRVKAVMYFPIPRSWNKVTQAKMKGQPHELRPDIDNCGKSILDALYPTGDSRVHKLDLEKLWDDGAGPRVEVTLY